MNNPLISVIVPIYKVEKYLDRCVESIVNQTYKNIEIILVDDGSTDSCPQMCDKWAAKDNRIKVIHKKNEGAGKARNIGLDVCNGNYVSFIDSDDYISDDYLARLYSFIDDEIDIVECEYLIVEDNNALFSRSEPIANRCDVTDALRQSILERAFKQVIWNKLYKKSVISNYRFPEHYKIDDEFWTYKVIANCKNLIHINSQLYAYRQQHNSVMHTLSIKQRIQPIIAKKERVDFISERFPCLYSDCVISLYATCLFQTQCVYRDGLKKEKQEFKKISESMLKRYRLNYNYLKRFSIKYRIWYYLFSLSVPLTCNLRNLLRIGL